MKTFVIRYTNDKSDVATNVAHMIVATIDAFGRDYGELWMFFYTQDSPTTWDHLVLAARKSDVKSWKQQYTV
jgi:hypothetical protein